MRERQLHGKRSNAGQSRLLTIQTSLRLRINVERARPPQNAALVRDESREGWIEGKCQRRDGFILLIESNRRRFVEVEPFVYEDGDSVTMQFQIGEIQSEMLVSDPNFLTLSYTRTMMAFMLFNKDPRHIAMIGLGGGSMPKWCYRQLPTAHITVIEINPKVIALRDQFLHST